MNEARILSYEHVGIRISDVDEAMDFYRRLGFRLAVELGEGVAYELSSEDGVRINLINNGRRQAGAYNVLQDAPEKFPGMTHAAFVVDSIETLQARLRHCGIVVTEGPLMIGTRRCALFVRDPDGNVLEFNELMADAGGEHAAP